MNTILQKRIEEAAKVFSFNFPSELFHSLQTQHERKLWKDEIEQAYIYGGEDSLQNQWISVEEALPEKNTMCFVRKETEAGVIYDTDYIDYEGKWFFNFNRVSIKSMVITHWCPIPKIGGEK